MGNKTGRLISIAAVTVVAALSVVSAAYAIRYRHTFSYYKSISLSIREGNRIYGKPNPNTDWLLSLAVEADRGNWDKVARLTEEDRVSEIGTYYHNLANAVQGKLGEKLMDYYQPFERGLFLSVDENTTPFVIAQAGEVWWQLGDMTMAEHHTMLGMIFSPAHDGSRFIKRLAAISLVNEDEGAAEKYLRLSGGNASEGWESRKALIQKQDFVHSATDIRSCLQGLVKSNPDNIMAYEYLLCYDLMHKETGAFAEDYIPGKHDCRLYQEALLIYLASCNTLTQENAGRYGIPYDLVGEFYDFTRDYQACGGKVAALKERYGRTYWFWFKFATRNEK